MAKRKKRKEDPDYDSLFRNYQILQTRCFNEIIDIFKHQQDCPNICAYLNRGILARDDYPTKGFLIGSISGMLDLMVEIQKFRKEEVEDEKPSMPTCRL